MTYEEVKEWLARVREVFPSSYPQLATCITYADALAERLASAETQRDEARRHVSIVIRERDAQVEYSDALAARVAELEATIANERPALRDVRMERERQDAKWGEQNHPDGTGRGVMEDMSYRCTTAAAAQGQCERVFALGTGTYAHILYEEVCEAFEETDPARLRTELVQVAAVCVAWVEKLDRAAMLAADKACGGGS